MRLIFFRLYKNKQFSYKPIFYDPKKEEFEEKVRKIKAELNLNDTTKPYIPRITYGSFRRYSKVLNREHKKSIIRVLFIALILVILIYLFFIMS